MARKKQTDPLEKTFSTEGPLVDPVSIENSEAVAKPFSQEEEGTVVEESVLASVETSNPELDALSEIPLIPQEDRLPTVPQLLVAITLLLVVLGYPTAQQFMGKPATATTDPTPVLVEPVHEEMSATPAPIADPFEGILLDAKAAYVWDVTEQRALFNKNASAQLPLASLTKLMTALVALEIYGPDATIPITLSAISQEGENGFQDGDVWRAKDLIDFTLMTSSNDGAYALASALAALGSGDTESFLKRMNAKAEEIGLTQTYFTNPTGLDASETQSGSYGSARDIAFLMEYIIEFAPEILEDTTKVTEQFTDASGTVYTATNTNESIEKVPYPLGSKTGYTVLAGGNLVVAFDAGPNRPIVVSVLGSSREGRFRDVEALRERVLASFTLPE